MEQSVSGRLILEAIHCVLVRVMFARLHMLPKSLVLQSHRLKASLFGILCVLSGLSTMKEITR